MFCKKCGTQIKEGDQFCGECGQPVSEIRSNNEGTYTTNNNVNNQGNTYRVEVQIPSLNLSGCRILELVKMYLFKPLSFFSEFKDSDNVKTSIALVLALPILYGLISIMYGAALISSFFSTLKKLPDLLAKAGIISFQEAIEAQTEFATSSEFLGFRKYVENMIDNKKVFLNNFLLIFGIIIITAIIIGIINAAMLKGKINLSNIIFIASASYIPLVVSLCVATIASMISILLGIFIVICGYILSFITLYSGIRQFSDEKNDKIFGIMVILFSVISILEVTIITMKFESSLLTIRNFFESVNNFL